MFLQLTTPQFITLLTSSKHFHLVGVMDGDRFEKERIPGSVVISENEIEERAYSLFSKEELVVVYCESMESRAGERAACKLASLGYKHIIHFPGGLEDYKSTYLPIAGHVKKHVLETKA